MSRIEEDEAEAEKFRIFERVVTPQLRAERIRLQSAGAPKMFNLSKLVRNLVNWNLFDHQTFY